MCSSAIRTLVIFHHSISMSVGSSNTGCKTRNRGSWFACTGSSIAREAAHHWISRAVQGGGGQWGAGSRLEIWRFRTSQACDGEIATWGGWVDERRPTLTERRAVRVAGVGDGDEHDGSKETHQNSEPSELALGKYLKWQGKRGSVGKLVSEIWKEACVFACLSLQVGGREQNCALVCWAENTHVDEAGVESPSSIWTYGSCEADFFMSLRLRGEASFSLSLLLTKIQFFGPLSMGADLGKVDDDRPRKI
jgi:hypothetical protein